MGQIENKKQDDRLIPNDSNNYVKCQESDNSN